MTPTTPRLSQLLLLALLLWISALQVACDDCTNRTGIFHYNSQRCHNSTHFLTQSGSCKNGVHKMDYGWYTACENTDHPDQPGHCHECGASRLVCSNSDNSQIACDDSHLDGICDSHNTFSLYWGCATQQMYFQNSQVCASNSGSNGGEEEHHQSMCGDKYLGLQTCLSCQGAQLCVARGDETCKSLGMQHGLAHGVITPKTEAPTPSPTPANTGQGEGGGGNNDGIYNETEQTLYLPIDPQRDTDFACDSFRGDVNFYHETCFNATHSMVTSGLCINETLAFGSHAISPCTNTGETLTHCHTCQNKLVCSSSSDADLVCQNVFTDPLTCPLSTDHDPSRPNISSTYTDCVNETDYEYAYEFCANDKADSSAFSPVTNSDMASCNDNFDGLTNCIGCKDGMQLCAREGRLACHLHDYKEELAELEPPIDCKSVAAADIDFYKERCYNATHTVIWSGRCIEGEIVGVGATINSCTDSGEGQQYCHDCSHSHLVCSQAVLTQEACSIPGSAEEQGLDSGTCDTNKDRTSSFGKCINKKTFTYIVAKCVENDLTVDRTTEMCGDTFEGFPYCASCDSFQICSSEEKTCQELGLHSSDPYGGGTGAGSGGNTDSDGEDTEPPNFEFDDAIQCQFVTHNANYYVEECFNSTHVKLSQGECVNGVKLGRETALQSCSDYGEDPSRKFCHHCGASVVCSNSYTTSLVCGMKLSLRDVESHKQPTCSETSSQLAGDFGCVDSETFSATFQTCDRGEFSAERNAYRCADRFPGYSYCNTCGKFNICTTEEDISCEALGF